jgi:hypothetical protein
MDYDQISVEGIVLPNRRLSNLDIEHAVKQLNIPDFIGCLCRNELPDKANAKECGILNLDDTSGEGTHWVAWHKNGDLKIYFDSFGLDPPIELISYLKSPIQCNTDQVQDDDSFICGHLCLFVLKRLSMGESYQELLNNLI